MKIASLILGIHLLGAAFGLLTIVFVVVLRMKRNYELYPRLAFILACGFVLQCISGVGLAIAAAAPVISVCDNLAVYLGIFVVAEVYIIRTAQKNGIGLTYRTMRSPIAFSTLAVVLALVGGY